MSKKKAKDKSDPLRWMELGCGLLLVGIASSALGAPGIGGWVSVIGAGLAVVGIHRFGRQGPDPALVFAKAGKKRAVKAGKRLPREDNSR